MPAALSNLRTQGSPLIYILILCLWIFPSLFQCTSLLFPLTVGGFTATTTLESYNVDSMQNIIMAGNSQDTQLVTTSGQKFVMYYENSIQNYKWAVKFTSSLAFYSVRIRDDLAEALLFMYSSSSQELIFLSTTDGSEVKHFKFSQSSRRMLYVMYMPQCSSIFGYSKYYSSTIYGSYGNLIYFTMDPSTAVSPNPIYEINGSYYLNVQAAVSGPDFIVVSTSDYYYDKNQMMMYQTSPIVAIKWYKQVDIESTISQLDTLTQGTDRYIFGCQEFSASKSFQLKKLWSDNFSVPSETTNAQYYKSFQISHATDTYTCKGIKALTIDSVIVAILAYNSAATELYKLQIFTLDLSTLTYMKKTWKSLMGTKLGTVRFVTADFFYLAGLDVWAFLATKKETTFTGTALPYVFYTDPSRAYVDVSFQIIDPTSYNINPVTISTSVSKTLSIPSLYSSTMSFSTIATGVPSALLVPTYNKRDTCLIQGGTDVSVSNDYYITDTITQVHTVSITDFPTCTPDICSSFYLEAEGLLPPKTLVTYDDSTQIATIQTTDTTFNGKTVNILYRAIWPATAYTNCVMQYTVGQLNMKYVTITAVSQVNIYYVIGDPMSIKTLTAFTVNPTGLVDPRFNIKYSLVDTNGIDYTICSQSAQLISLINSFDSSTPALHIKSSLNSDGGNYVLKLKAEFDSYNPSYSVLSSAFGFYVTIPLAPPDPCLTVTITPSTATSMFYLIVGETKVMSITQWTDSDSTSSCSDIVYSLSPSNPSFVSQDPVISTNINVQPTLDSQEGVYQIELLGSIMQTPSFAYTSETMKYPLTVISLKTTYITAPSALTDYTYTATDPASLVTLQAFIPSVPTYSLVYSLTIDGALSYDTSLFTFSAVDRKLTIYTPLLSKVGVYPLTLTAIFNIPIDYSVSSSFVVTVLSPCERNLITSAQISDIKYYIGDSQIDTYFSSWTMNMTECGPIREYTAKMVNGMSLPPFIKFDGKARKISVSSSQIGDIGDYQIEVKGVTDKFTSISLTTSIVEISLLCQVKAITSNEVGTWEVIIGTFKSSTFNFAAVTLTPDCPAIDPSFSVKYSASLASGTSLPSYLTFDSSSRLFIVTDTGTLVAQPVNLLVTASVLYGTSVKLTKSFKKLLNIVAPTSATALPSSLLGSVQLPPMNIKCPLSESVLIISSDFSAQVPDYPGSYFLENPKNLPYVTLNGQTLTIVPTKVSEIGKAKVYLYCEDATNQKYLQIVNIEVFSTNPSLNLDQTQPLIAKINSMSRTGKVQVKFNQRMLTPQNATIIDNQFLKLAIFDSDNKIQNYNFTWKTMSFEENLLLILIEFDNPYAISRQSYDQLEIKLIDNSLLSSIDTYQYLKLNTTLRYNIPKQLDKGSQNMEELADSVGGSISSAMDSALGGPIVAFILNRIWGMVNSVQIVLLLPLGDIELPANTQLTSQAIQSGSQQQFMKALSLDNFEFENKKPFNKQFDEQGFKSVYIIDNLKPLFKNINIIFMAITLLLIIDAVLTFMIQKEYGLFKKLRYLFAFNFIIKLYIENSLQIFVFAFIDIIESSRTSLSEKASTFFASMSLAILYAIAIGNFVFVRKQIDNYSTLQLRYPSIAVLYQLLEKYQKQALYFKSVFITRRFLVAFVYVILRDYQGIQLMIQILITLSMLMYLNKCPPYASKAMNIIEYFNEILVISCQYYLLTFAQLSEDQDQLRSQLGLGFSILVIVQFVGSFIALVVTKIVKLLPTLKILFYKLKFKIRDLLLKKRAKVEDIYLSSNNEEKDNAPDQNQKYIKASGQQKQQFAEIDFRNSTMHNLVSTVSPYRNMSGQYHDRSATHSLVSQFEQKQIYNVNDYRGGEEEYDRPRSFSNKFFDGDSPARSRIPKFEELQHEDDAYRLEDFTDYDHNHNQSDVMVDATRVPEFLKYMQEQQQVERAAESQDPSYHIRKRFEKNLGYLVQGNQTNVAIPTFETFSQYNKQ